jgi:hypothetical protein
MRARRLAWLLGALAVVAAVVVVAVRALPHVEPRPVVVARPEGRARAAAAPAPAPAPAAAGDSKVEQASQLAGQADAAAAAGNTTEARALLVRAYALDPKPGMLLLIGGLDLAAGRCREARSEAQRVAAETTGQLADQARDLLERAGHCD